MQNLKDIDEDLKSSNPNALCFTRAQYGPWVLNPHLDNHWDQISSTLPVVGIMNISDMVQVQEAKIWDISDKVEHMNKNIIKTNDKLKMPSKSVLAKIFGDCEHICKLRKRKDTVWDNRPKDELESKIRTKMT